MKTSKLRLTMFLVLALTMILAACGKKNETNAGGASPSASESAAESASSSPAASAASDTAPHSDKNPVVTIEMDNGHTIKLELFPDIAPNTVNNYISLIKKGFYDGTIFHRVMPGFMIQGGDPNGNGTGGPGYSIKGEFTANGFQNDLKHKRGILSMARKSQPLDSAGSQFFIMVADAPSLDGQYAAFGNVLEGMDTVDEIVNQKIDPSDPYGTMPLKPMAIKKMTVDTKGVEYKEPETIK
ncbi:peptidylprolyl isomerase [Cohnella candidum]|uniref:Peptidyl-prolyl cis-trans isomerase n=1 Tax=Cohnella candidum TaxID=2674991 RepID=A0A3G3K1C3_9BACL|nr:peptidylprolyl isomerase [Cohnella candidum]AYQ74306.1 peptidylprolyl isomerase [Cohnella candidum]